MQHNRKRLHRHKLPIYIGLIVVCSFPKLVLADAAGWAIFGRQATQMQQSASHAALQLAQLKQEYTQLKEQYAAMTGHYGWGNLENSASDLTGREIAAPSWKAALEGEAGGNPARYQELLAQYKQAHKTMSQSDYEKGADKGLSTSYQNQVKTNQASATTATYEFNDIDKHLKTLQTLSKKIEDAKNSNTKSAMDLNSRIEVEVGYISIEILRMQTVLNQQTAQSQANRIAEENETSQFNQAGEQND